LIGPDPGKYPIRENTRSGKIPDPGKLWPVENRTQENFNLTGNPIRENFTASGSEE
jgi:hypothetical protein